MTDLPLGEISREVLVVTTTDQPWNAVAGRETTWEGGDDWRRTLDKIRDIAAERGLKVTHWQVIVTVRTRTVSANAYRPDGCIQ